MPPRCQRLLPAGYPDASLSAQTPSGADGRRLAAGRASGALAGSVGTVDPPRRGCLAAPPHGTTGSSSAGPCHTRSRCRRFADSEGRDTVDSPVAPSHTGGLDSGVKYGHTDRAGGPPSPKATLRGAESSLDLTPPASFLLPILSQLCRALPARLHTRPRATRMLTENRALTARTPRLPPAADIHPPPPPFSSDQLSRG